MRRPGLVSVLMVIAYVASLAAIVAAVATRSTSTPIGVFVSAVYAAVVFLVFAVAIYVLRPDRAGAA